MKIDGIIWLRAIVDKLDRKHNVTPEEVESVLRSNARFRFIERGDVDGEDMYAALGRTFGGRYLIVYFIYKKTHDALIISAREMNKQERRSYGKK